AVVGSVIGGWDGWRGNIYRLAVAPQARRRGLARRLLHEAERVLVARGARRSSARVEPHELHAIGFWDALSDRGWRRDERMLRYVKMAGPPARWSARDLCSRRGLRAGASRRAPGIERSAGPSSPARSRD